MTPALPLELCELIIDELKNSTPELKSCSLTCKDWLPRCRVHLFRVLKITTPLRVRARDEEHMKELFEEQNKTLLTFRKSEASGYIRGVHLDGRVRDVDARLDGGEPGGDGDAKDPTIHGKGRTVVGVKGMIVLSLPSTILPFRQIRFLRLRWKVLACFNRDSYMDGQERFERMLAQIESLEHLVVEGYRFFDAGTDLLGLIAANSPRLKILCLSQISWYPSFSEAAVIEGILDDWERAFVKKGLPRLGIERLCLREVLKKGTNVIRQIVLPSPCLDLTRLRYLNMAASELCWVLRSEEFRGLGGAVTHLTLDFLDTSEITFGSDRTDDTAAIFPNLRHLQLCCRDYTVLSSFLGRMADMQMVLDTLHINLDAEEDVNDILSGRVDVRVCALLANDSQFCETRITVDFKEADSSSQVQRELMKERLPRAFQTGKLGWIDRKVMNWWFYY